MLRPRTATLSLARIMSFFLYADIQSWCFLDLVKEHLTNVKPYTGHSQKKRMFMPVLWSKLGVDLEGDWIGSIFKEWIGECLR